MKKFLFLIIDWLLFRPLAWTWRTIYRIRRYGYQFGFLSSHFFAVPIISVGNISFGGTGKTPFTMWLVDYFEKKQKKVMVLMRGYKGALEDTHGIIRGNFQIGPSPKNFGDEALLIARRMKNSSVVVGKNRALNLEHYFPSEKPDVVLLDDGHQHLKLNRALNIVLFDAMMPLQKYDAAPRGYLREGLTSLSVADLAVIGRSELAGEDKVKSLKKFLATHLRPNTPFAEFTYRPEGLFNSKYQHCYKMEELQGKNVICVTGIASPDSFFASIEETGAVIIDRISFPDHHDFTGEQINGILSKASESNALVVATEKDMVKIRRLVDDERLLFLQINLHFTAGEEHLERLLTPFLEN